MTDTANVLPGRSTVTALSGPGSGPNHGDLSTATSLTTPSTAMAAPSAISRGLPAGSTCSTGRTWTSARIAGHWAGRVRFGGSGDPDDVPPEPPAEPVSALGDLWRIGERLLVGDATDMAAVEKMLDGDRCDCMWTDPPYGVAIVGGSHALSPAERLARGGKTIQNDASGEELPELLAGTWAVATAALRPGAAVYIAHPDRFRLVFENAMLDAGWQFREELVWVKDSLVLGAKDYHFRHESILYGFTAGGKGRLGRGGDRWYGNDSQTTIFDPAPQAQRGSPDDEAGRPRRGDAGQFLPPPASYRAVRRVGHDPSLLPSVSVSSPLSLNSIRGTRTLFCAVLKATAV